MIDRQNAFFNYAVMHDTHEYVCLKGALECISLQMDHPFEIEKPHLMTNNKKANKELMDVVKWMNVRQNDFTFHVPLKRNRLGCTRSEMDFDPHPRPILCL